jgi:uncharacterized phage-associated protein
MTTATAVAEYLIGLGADPTRPPEEADLLSPGRLQHLLYYVQGYALALLDGPAFADDIRAGAAGPVVPAVADRYGHFGAAGIPLSEAGNGDGLPPLVQGMADMVWAGFGKHSAGELARRTRGESPWLAVRESARADSEADPVIPPDALRGRFVERVAADVAAIPYPVPDPVDAWRGEAEALAGRTRSLGDVADELKRHPPARAGR